MQDSRTLVFLVYAQNLALEKKQSFLEEGWQLTIAVQPQESILIAKS